MIKHVCQTCAYCYSDDEDTLRCDFASSQLPCGLENWTEKHNLDDPKVSKTQTCNNYKKGLIYENEN